MKRYKLITTIVMALTLSTGFSFTSFAAWQQDSIGWQYQNADGSILKNTWQEVDNAWYYFDANGYRATGFQKIGFNYYYFDPISGIMQSSTTLLLDGDSCTFDKGGAMIYGTFDVSNITEPSLEPGYFNNSTYINPWADYQITFPDNYQVAYLNPNTVQQTDSVDLVIGAMDNTSYLNIFYVKIPSSNAYTPEELVTIYAQGLTAQSIAKNQTPVVTKTLGGYDYKYVSCFTDSGVYCDYYCREVNGYYMFIQSMYMNHEEMDNIINSMKKVN